MTAESHARLQKMVDQLWEHLHGAGGFKDYKTGIAALRENVQKNPAVAPFLHSTARQLYSTTDPDSVRPENFHAILGLIDDKEKASAVLRELPEEAVPEIEGFLQWALKQWLPALRLNAKSMAKHLPQRRGGGRPKTPLTKAECRQICKEINKLHANGVPKLVAQNRVAQQRGMSTRSVQRVWAQRTGKQPRKRSSN